jgi:methylated-DNA-[protein]-cysteine S-methyltransferase
MLSVIPASPFCRSELTEPFYRRLPTVWAAAVQSDSRRDNAHVTALDWAWLDTPVGVVAVGCSAVGIARVRFGAPPGTDAPPANGRQTGRLAVSARRQLAEYFAGQRRSFDLPLDWSATAGTQRHVLEVLTGSVGYGQTTTYGVLAGLAGLATTGDVLPARAVGTIMGSNPIPVIVPCHRVLATAGLGGYSGGTGPEVKRWLLILEGALPPTLDWQPALPEPGT